MLTSGRNGEALLNKIHNKINLISVYIFAGRIDVAISWAKKFFKVESIHNDPIDLTESLNNTFFVKSKLNKADIENDDCYSFKRIESFLKD